MVKPEHLVFAPIPAYGHIRPLCALACKIAIIRSDIIVSIFLAPHWLSQAQSDVNTYFPDSENTNERIRLISLFEPNTEPTPLLSALQKTQESYKTAYSILHQGKSIVCAATGYEFPAVAPPTAVILDVFALPQLESTRSISGTAVPVFMFLSAGAAALIQVFCPASMGGQGELSVRIEEAARLGMGEEEIEDKIFRHTDGTVLEIPGLPPMYDYEMFPQSVPLGVPIAHLHASAIDMLAACDGVFVNTTPAYDGASLSAFRSWAKQNQNKRTYAIGPLLPPGYGTGNSMAGMADPKNTAVHSFLDAMASKHGVQSVLFISFGSIFWPQAEEQLEELINVLLEKQFPFIICYPSPSAHIPDQLLRSIETSGIGLAVRWAPQQYILSHPATGWFLSHCGHGGVFEALGNGVPMICWPFGADQPIAALHLSQSVGAAFHLLEIRTGKGLQPLYSRDHGGPGYAPKGTREAMRMEFQAIFDSCRGSEGEEKRRKARTMQEELLKAWMPGGGSAVGAMSEFFRDYLDPISTE
ncbi:glycosyltransferase family 1 protein [Favolaschia claudopus]|uniref:Glycosyltransferase family 1 protein n=1 Tax=Favolaschia claudopus TaxID=2862362 RepID=A0AAW0CU38_9AGAR